MDRRDVVTGGLAAGVAAALGSPASVAAQQVDGDRLVSAAIGELRQTVEGGLEVSPELSRIREQQRAFLRSNNKFPDYVEIGIGVWEGVYDWHIRHRLPATIVRTPEGRYAMTVMETILVLRPEQPEMYVGLGFDVR